MLKVFQLLVCLVGRGALSGANTSRLPFDARPTALSPGAASKDPEIKQALKENI